MLSNDYQSKSFQKKTILMLFQYHCVYYNQFWIHFFSCKVIYHNEFNKNECKLFPFPYPMFNVISWLLLSPPTKKMSQSDNKQHILDTSRDFPVVQPKLTRPWLFASSSCSNQSGPPPCKICSRNHTKLMKAHRVQVTTKQPWKQSDTIFSLEKTNTKMNE